jgi:hypothetical protein
LIGHPLANHLPYLLVHIKDHHRFPASDGGNGYVIASQKQQPFTPVVKLANTGAVTAKIVGANEKPAINSRDKNRLGTDSGARGN